MGPLEYIRRMQLLEGVPRKLFPKPTMMRLPASLAVNSPLPRSYLKAQIRPRCGPTLPGSRSDQDGIFRCRRASFQWARTARRAGDLIAAPKVSKLDMVLGCKHAGVKNNIRERYIREGKHNRH